jgi:hypothetical protein
LFQLIGDNRRIAPHRHAAHRNATLFGRHEMKMKFTAASHRIAAPRPASPRNAIYSKVKHEQ